MKYIASLLLVFGLVFSSHAEVTATIKKVHLCCDKCAKGVEKAVATVPGAEAKVNKNKGIVKITAPDQATAQRAADAMVAAGYFGTSTDVKLDPAVSRAHGTQVQGMIVAGAHLCCAKCVKAVDEAVKSVPGVTECDAIKGSDFFDVTGNFNDQAVMTALQNAGFSGKITRSNINLSKAQAN